MPDAEFLPGTLDLLILKSVSLGPQHGYGILLRIQQLTGQALKIEQGALYPALYRLETRTELDAEWGVSENNGVPSSTRSRPLYASACRMRSAAGTAWPLQWKPQ